MDKLTFAIATFAAALAVAPAVSQQGGRGGPPFQPKPEELQQVKTKTEVDNCTHYERRRYLRST